MSNQTQMTQEAASSPWSNELNKLPSVQKPWEAGHTLLVMDGASVRITFQK